MFKQKSLKHVKADKKTLTVLIKSNNLCMLRCLHSKISIQNFFDRFSFAQNANRKNVPENTNLKILSLRNVLLIRTDD